MPEEEIVEPEVLIFQPDYTLKEKIGKDTPITALLRPEVIQMAQAVIMESKKDFIGYMQDDVREIQSILKRLEETTWDAELLEQFMRLVLQVKARAGTFGFPLATEIARKLYVFCEDEYRAKSDHTLIIRKHVEGLAVVIGQRIEGDGGAIGQALVASLDQLAAKLR